MVIYTISDKKIKTKFANTGITSLGPKLKHVFGNLNLYGTNVTSLGNIETIERDLIVANSPLMSLGNLQRLGGEIYANEGEQYEKLQAENNRRFVIRPLHPSVISLVAFM